MTNTNKTKIVLLKKERKNARKQKNMTKQFVEKEHDDIQIREDIKEQQKKIVIEQIQQLIETAKQRYYTVDSQDSFSEFVGKQVMEFVGYDDNSIDTLKFDIIIPNIPFSNNPSMDDELITEDEIPF